MAFHTDRITIYIPKEKEMGLTRPKVAQVEQKPDEDYKKAKMDIFGQACLKAY